MDLVFRDLKPLTKNTNYNNNYCIVILINKNTNCISFIIYRLGKLLEGTTSSGIIF